MQQSWDQYYKQHDRFHLQPHHDFKKFLTLLEQEKAQTVLDLGCGSGRHLIELAGKGYDVQGIDFSPAAVDIAQKWLMEKELSGRVSIADLHDEIKAFADESFDAVVAVNSLTEAGKDKFMNSLHEINRLLKTGGTMFLVVPGKPGQGHKGYYFDEDSVRESLRETFEILELFEDPDANLVVIAKEK